MMTPNLFIRLDLGQVIDMVCSEARVVACVEILCVEV